MPRSVLFLCHGNICRSPFAEAVFRKSLPESARGFASVSSAGFFGRGRPSPDGAVRVASHHDADLSSHRSRSVTGSLLRDADIVVVMDTRQRAAARRLAQGDVRTILLLGDVDPESIDTRTVRDPVEQPDDVFAQSYARIVRCVEAMASVLVERGEVTEIVE
jgi:protein-tyrosine phosphatase